jgi:hypothetical protein
MGSGPSLPPGEALYIQEPTCCSGGKLKFQFEYSQPASLASVPSDKWVKFQSAVHEQATQILNNEMAWLFFIPFWLLTVGVPESGFFLGIIGFALVLGGSFYVVNQNKQRDNQISELCTQFTAETGVALQYYQQYTGACKPKGARTVRAIIITSMPSTIGVATGPAVTTMMSVQVPPGAQAGQTLQIQTASGPMNVIVPEGVAEGETFQVGVPAAPIPTVQATPVAVQATQVQATPVQAQVDEENPNMVDEENPNMEGDGKVNPPIADGIFCPIHGRFPGQTVCPKCSPPEIN